MQLIKSSLLLLMFSQWAFANPDENFGMIPVPIADFVEDSTISDMPPVVSQDSLGICYAMAAAKLIDRQTCVDQGVNCANMDASFALRRWT